MDAQELRNLQEAYMEVVENQQFNEAKKPFPFKKVEAKMKEKRAKSVWDKKGNPAVPNTTDDEKKATTQHSKMFRTYEKEKRAKQEADKARRSPTFYKDTHPTSAPKMKKANEEVDIYDIILSHLLDEGYAETPEAAEVIMVNMSEEWRDSILG